MTVNFEGLTMNQLAERNAELHTQIAELKRKVEALAAEVQAVRWASGQVYARGYNHGHLNTVDGLPYAEEKDLVIRGGDALCEYIDPDHCGVATDAILAEIRAQGVDGAIETIMIHMNHQHVDVKEALHILKTYSEQLRKEPGQ